MPAGSAIRSRIVCRADTDTIPLFQPSRQHWRPPHYNLVEEFLNEAGQDGGELVSVATTPTDYFTYLIDLKRPSLVENVRPALLGP